MDQLTSSQRKYLRQLAHDLKPVVQVGKQGLTDLVIEKVNRELDAHELIKVKFLDFHEQQQELVQEMVERSAVSLVALIGHVVILYREHPDWERRVITLPA